VADIKLEGIDELISKLGKLGAEGRDIKKDALSQAGEIVARSMKELAPRSKEGNLHMADHIKVSDLTEQNGLSYVNVGPSKGDNSSFFYSKFTEWGTSKIPAVHWAEGSLQKNRKKIKDVIYGELKRRLDSVD
jgi:HK97 gp10 family phage protein